MKKMAEAWFVHLMKENIIGLQSDPIIIMNIVIKELAKLSKFSRGDSPLILSTS